MIKTFKTIDEQIEILKSKGLEIDDINYAKNVLLRENYFFLSGYRHVFLKSDGSIAKTRYEFQDEENMSSDDEDIDGNG